MRDLVNKAQSFITFDMPLQADFISLQFANIHHQCEKEFPRWSTNSTRQKVIATYWLSHVLKHCLFLFSMSVLIVLITKMEFRFSYLSGFLIGGFIVLPVLFLSHYWPKYSQDFLPKLETVKEIFEEKQNEQLGKCRQAQLSNFALSLIFYVFDKASGMNTLQCNDRSSELLMQLYGVDKGSLKKNLELILGKKRVLPPRKYTEILNRFGEAYTFFEELQFAKGVHLLKELEAKFQS